VGADRLLVDLSGDGRVSVGTWLDGELPESGASCQLTWPLDDDALEDLRWYLEDYLRAPFGVYGDRGPQVEAALAGWGRAVFSAVFGAGPARDAYLRVRARQRPAEVVFRSSSPGLLGLPWELMADPGRQVPLAVDLAGVSRSLPVAEAAETVPVPEGRLRVLMVIARPAGTGDVGYRMIARPLLDRLEAVRGEVDLVVLRPPTLPALGEALAGAAGAGEPFQVVHFDGHGVLAGRRVAGTPLVFAGPGPEGVLVFEKPGGGPEEVPSSRVAQVLAAAGVPVVVLNACQSGAVGKDLEAAVATRLLGAGVASVVAMAYSVYAVAAAEFMAAFYERLFTGGTVTVAVTAGRQRLYQQNRRPSPKGELALADWVVPVHYLRREVSFPQARTERAADLPPLEQLLDAQLAAGRAAGSGAGELDAVGSFVGRDDLFFQLEAAARLQKVVVLTGSGGTGKTELVKAFGRWWRDTRGVDRPEWVFWHSFEPGVASFGLDGVITQIGLQLFGNEFARQEPQQRRDVVQEVLAERRMLLIWDNFETVQSMPDPAGATDPLNEAGCANLREFLEHLAAHDGSAALITSRAAEDWLGEVRRITVGGLAAQEAAEYAGNLLAPFPAAGPRRSRRAFGELMEWLDGHPLSMRLILPRLDTAEPEALLAGLRGAAPLPGGHEAGQGRTTSLPASVSYSFTHLAKATRRLLPAVCLFHAVADANVLHRFSQVPWVPGRFGGATMQDWEQALDDAARVGLLTGLGGGMYRIHPALPGYLANWWRREEPGNHDAAREAATRAVLSAHADLGGWLSQQISSGDAGMAYTVIGLERRTLGSLVGYALEHGLWEDAQLIARPLNEYWDARGLEEEAGAWADRARLATEDPDGTPPQLDTPAGDLWLFATGSQAIRQMERRHLDDAERTYQQTLTAFQAQPTSPRQQDGLATTYHQLGNIAQARGRLDEAEDWYRKSLAIEEELGNAPGTADSYHQLGMAAQARGRLDEAEDWYLKSLAISEELGNTPRMVIAYHQLGMAAQDGGRLDQAEDWHRKSLAISEELGNTLHVADSYHALGMVAQNRGRLDEAEDWYLKSLAIKEELANTLHMTSSYHQLGWLAQNRGRLDEAEDWYLKSLAISEELGNTPAMAMTYHQLGMVAQNRGRLDEAEDWYLKSLAIKEELGNMPGMAMTYHQLGIVAQDRGRLDDAENWYRKSLGVEEELGNTLGMARTFGQLGLLAEERGQAPLALEWMVRCVALFSEFPHPASGPAPGHLARLASQVGTGALEQCWQYVTGSLLPNAIRSYVESAPAHGRRWKRRRHDR
jgi:tetratricopeptide (TPR) repeat protein